MAKPKVKPKIYSNKIAHYTCLMCADNVYREGGHATAKKHMKVVHGSTAPGYKVDSRMPQRRERVYKDTLL